MDQTLVEKITLEEELVQQTLRAPRLQVSPFVYYVITMNGWRDLPLSWQ